MQKAANDTKVEDGTAEAREKLYRYLDAPLGSIDVVRRQTPDKEDFILVRMVVGSVVPHDRRPPIFAGFPVQYRLMALPKPEPRKVGRFR